MILRRVDGQLVKAKLESNCCVLWQKYLRPKFNSMGGNSEDFTVKRDGTCSTLDEALLARSRYSEGPAIGHLDTGFS